MNTLFLKSNLESNTVYMFIFITDQCLEYN